MTDRWWAPIVAVALAAFMLSAFAGVIDCVMEPKFRRRIGGLLILLFIFATVFSYAYAVLTPSGVSPATEYECLGPPYDACG